MAIILTSYSLLFFPIMDYKLSYIYALKFSREAILALALISGIIFSRDEVIKVVTPGPCPAVDTI